MDMLYYIIFIFNLQKKKNIKYKLFSIKIKIISHSHIFYLCLTIFMIKIFKFYKYFIIMLFNI